MIKRIERELRVVIRNCPERKNRILIKINDCLELSDADSRQKLEEAKERIQSLVARDVTTFSSTTPFSHVRQKMTHFVSLPLTFESVKKQFNNFVDQVFCDPEEANKRHLDPELCVEVDKFHLTLVLLCLDTKVKEKIASQLLADCVEQLIRPLLDQTPNALTINLKGVNVFSDEDRKKARVLFATVQDAHGQSPPKHLQQLANQLTQKFFDHQLLYGGRVDVKLHATLMKSSQRKGNYARKAAFDARGIFEKHSNFEFGNEIRLNEIHLSCLKGVDEKRYYKPLIKFEIPQPSSKS